MRTLAERTGNDLLDADVEELANVTGRPIAVLRDGPSVGIVVKDVALPSHFNCEEVDVLMITSMQYPHEAMDMFWVDDLGLRLATGGEAQGSDVTEQHFGQAWRRFSWHRHSEWSPGRDTLIGHFEFVLARLAKTE
jgi:hypothetical protein